MVKYTCVSIAYLECCTESKMNKEDARLAKKKILKCLTEDFEYGVNKKTKQPLKRRKRNLAVYNKRTGEQVFCNTDLSMIMDKVVLGLYLAIEDSS